MKYRSLSPSVLFLITLLIGVFLSWVQPWQLSLYLENRVIQMIGLFLLVISLILNTLAYREFKKSGTPHAPFMRPKVLIKNGVFAVSRNPVYLALVLSECGLAFVFDSLWLLVTALLLWIVLDRVIVRAEEKILHHTFKQEHEAYRKRTRRWM
ncbi:MAG TPA: isoprenylcysteine carboxylmethyltransferase family protein [Sulfurovum sp.]|uniref:methyltransferase family protein n=1 Tax=Sulfurovum sp. TaxID=1969726 RepID=UPI002F954A28